MDSINQTMIKPGKPVKDVPKAGTHRTKSPSAKIVLLVSIRICQRQLLMVAVKFKTVLARMPKRVNRWWTAQMWNPVD
jgi:hypothetical protein